MPRGSGNAPAGLVYHALNQAVARSPLFQKDADYEALGTRHVNELRPVLFP